VQAPYEPSWSRAVHHLYVIRVDQRDQLQQYLTREKIGTGLHYPIPLHLQEAYAHLGYGVGQFPVAEKLANEILSLPMYPQMTNEQQYQVLDALDQFYAAAIEIQEVRQ